MTDRDFDKFAEDAIEREREWKATWEKFCERNDFETSRYSYAGSGTNNKRNWSKRTFRYALSQMPKNHPERWKYKVGAWFAPVDNSNGIDFLKESLVYSAIIGFQVALFFLGVQCYVDGRWEFGTLVMLLIAVPWIVYLLQRHRAFLL